MSDYNAVLEAVMEACTQAVGGRDVMANGKLYRIAAKECPVKAVRAYFVRAMDEAIAQVKDELGAVEVGG